MTVTDYRTPEQETQDRSARAKRAVDAFRKMQPMLNNYARVFTGNPRISVEVSATSNGATDGKKIFFRPPIALGDNLKHERKLCDKRDPETLIQLCAACEVRETVLVTIYHEIAHICYGTFAQPSDTDKASLIAQAVEEAGGRYAEYVAARIKRMPKYLTESYMGMAGTVSPYLHTILNALEDARVNNNLFTARRGTKAMFDADTCRVFRTGVESPQPDGSVKYLPWNEREQNLQAILAVFCHASGYDYADWFIPPVVEALADTELQALIAESVASPDVESNYKIAFKVLARLRELGFCVRPDEPEPEEQPTKPGEAGDQTGEGEADPNAEQEDGGGDDSDEADESGTGGAEQPSPEGGEGEDEDTSETEADGSGDSDEQDGSDEEADSPVAGDEDGESGDDPGADDEGLGDSSDAPESDESDSSERSDSGADADSSSGAGSDPDGDAGDSAGEDLPVDEADEEDEWERAEGNPEDQLDTGADEGEGGIEVKEDEYAHIPMGEPEDVDKGLEVFGHHEDKQPSPEEIADMQAILQAILQGAYFETPSTTVQGVREHYFGKPVLNELGEDMSTAWFGKLCHYSYSRHELGIDGDFKPAENILGPALLKLRTIFADNQRAHQQNHLKSGRVNTRVLGRRAPLGDERLFRKKIIPGKRDYFVAIGLDVSGSTMGRNLELIKAAGWAQADLLNRLGIPFAMFAYSGYHGKREDYYSGLYLDIYHVKDSNEPWNASTQERLQSLGPDGGNLDGHNIEYLRKVCDQSNATDKIIMYYSDGKMPATNHDEELEILRRELALCKKKGYTVAGVGVRTDSPSRHGLPTVQINDKNDIMLVVKHLEKMLLK